MEKQRATYKHLLLTFFLLFPWPRHAHPVVYSQHRDHAHELWSKLTEKVLQQIPDAKILHQDKPFMTGLWIPSPHKHAPLFIITSGVHGAEAPLGTTLQRLFLEQWLSHNREHKAQLLFIYAINDFGFTQKQRTNTNNVDLNRNFFSTQKINVENTSYQNLGRWLEPKSPATVSWISKLFFGVRLIQVYIFHGKKTILQALQGQSFSSEGLFYTGQDEQPETRVVKSWITPFVPSAKATLHIDLHTGFGERGRLHYYGSDEFMSPEQQQLVKKIFPDVNVDTGQDKDFYITHGDLVDWTWKTFPQQIVIPMVFEFGTMDSQTLWGGLNSLWITTIHNQGRHHGFQSSEDQKQIEHLYESLFNPQDEDWRQRVLNRGLQALWTSLERLEKMSL